jgi:hypothetical protein
MSKRHDINELQDDFCALQEKLTEHATIYAACVHDLRLHEEEILRRIERLERGERGERCKVETWQIKQSGR